MDVFALVVFVLDLSLVFLHLQHTFSTATDVNTMEVPLFYATTYVYQVKNNHFVVDILPF